MHFFGDQPTRRDKILNKILSRVLTSVGITQGYAFAGDKGFCLGESTPSLGIWDSIPIRNSYCSQPSLPMPIYWYPPRYKRPTIHAKVEATITCIGYGITTLVVTSNTLNFRQFQFLTSCVVKLKFFKREVYQKILDVFSQTK